MDYLKKYKKTLSLGYSLIILNLFLAYLCLVFNLGFRTMGILIKILFYLLMTLFILTALIMFLRLRAVKFIKEDYEGDEVLIYLGLKEVVLNINKVDVVKVQENYYFFKEVVKSFKKAKPLVLEASEKTKKIKVTIKTFHRCLRDYK